MQQASWNELLYSVQTGDKAFDRVFGMNAFEYLAQHREEAAVFNEAMTASSTQAAAEVTGCYDFSEFGTIADVGGGHGVLIATILKANPSLRGILFELPNVVEGATKRIATAGLSGRWEVIAGDFFQSVPAGAEAYVGQIAAGSDVNVLVNVGGRERTDASFAHYSAQRGSS